MGDKPDRDSPCILRINSNKANSSIFSFAVISNGSTVDLSISAGFIFITESNTNYGVFRTSNEYIADIHNYLSNKMTIEKIDTATVRIINENTWSARCWLLKY